MVFTKFGMRKIKRKSPSKFVVRHCFLFTDELVMPYAIVFHSLDELVTLYAFSVSPSDGVSTISVFCSRGP